MTVHVIWHHVPHSQISGCKEIVGIVTSGWKNAQEIVDNLNANDPDVTAGFRRENYWKQEVETITLENWTEFREN